MVKTFERIERKYIINKEQKEELEKVLKKHMVYDAFCTDGGSYWVQNIYYDTINNSFISKSIQKPDYKAKIRVRHYVGDDIYFLEWKQKTNKIVSKRRVVLTKQEFDDFFFRHKLPNMTKYIDKQIVNEFKYQFEHNSIIPSLYLSYQ